jgi:hypothetical protein
MDQDIETGTRSGHFGQISGVVRIYNAESGTDVPMSYTCLGLHFFIIKNHDAGRLASRSCSRRNADQRFDRAWYRFALADRRVHIFQEIGRKGGVEVCRLGSVHAGTASHTYKSIEPALLRKADCIPERPIGRFNPHIAEQHRIDSFPFQGFDSDCDRLFPGYIFVCHNHHSFRTQLLHVVPYFTGSAKAILDAGGAHCKNGFFLHGFLLRLFMLTPMLQSFRYSGPAFTLLFHRCSMHEMLCILKLHRRIGFFFSHTFHADFKFPSFTSSTMRSPVE